MFKLDVEILRILEFSFIVWFGKEGEEVVVWGEYKVFWFCFFLKLR